VLSVAAAAPNVPFPGQISPVFFADHRLDACPMPDIVRRPNMFGIVDVVKTSAPSDGCPRGSYRAARSFDLGLAKLVAVQ